MSGPSAVESLPEFIERNADRIYVWETVDGRAGAFALTELPVKLAMRHAMRFLLEGKPPHLARPYATGDEPPAPVGTRTFELIGVPPNAIRCRICGLTSFNPTDVAQRYCGSCHLFHEPIWPGGIQ